MPRVPVVDRTTVKDAPYQPAHFDGRAPAEAFGGGDAARGPDLRAPIGIAQQLAHKATQRANELAVLDADTRLSRLKQNLLYDEQGGLLNKRGKDTFAEPERIREVWDASTKEIANGLTNDEQRMAYERMLAARTLDLEGDVQRHVAGQRRVYDEEVTKNGVALKRDEAIRDFRDPAKVAESIAYQQAVLTDHARANGLPPEWLEAATRDAASATHMGVLTQLLATGADQQAAAYFAANKDAISADGQAQMSRALEEGSTRGESQRRADAILAKALGRKDATAAAEKITDPKVRDLVVARLDQHFQRQREIERERMEDTYLAAVNAVEANPGRAPRDVVPPTVWEQLSPAQRKALEHRDGDAPNNDKAWLDFLSLGDTGQAGLSRGEFETKYWSKLDKEHRRRAEEQWDHAREANAKGPKKAPNIQHVSTVGFTKLVDQSIRLAGIVRPDRASSGARKFSEQETADYARFEQEAAGRVNRKELELKRPLNFTEQQEIVDDLVAEYAQERLRKQGDEFSWTKLFNSIREHAGPPPVKY